MFGFFRKKFSQKMYPTPVKSLFENTMGNPFLIFFKYWPKRLKKKIRIEIWTFSFQICFRNQFKTLGSGQTENTQVRVFVYFPLDHFPKSKIDSKSRFEMRISIFLFQVFLKRFGQYLKKERKKIFHCIFKKGFDRCRVHFLMIFFCWKGQTIQNRPKFGW